MKRAEFLPPARLEFFSETQYYTAIEPDSGMRFVKAVEEAARQALVFPDTGFPAPGDTRRISLQEFPFSLIYRSRESGILIVAVAHQRRSPGHWASRV